MDFDRAGHWAASADTIPTSSVISTMECICKMLVEASNAERSETTDRSLANRSPLTSAQSRKRYVVNGQMVEVSNK